MVWRLYATDLKFNVHFEMITYSIQIFVNIAKNKWYIFVEFHTLKFILFPIMLKYVIGDTATNGVTDKTS